MKGTVKWFNTQKGYRTNGILVIIGSANILISMIRSLYVKQLKSNVFAKKES